jgi:hypothetical protein
MLPCLIPKIPHSEREKEKHHHCLRKNLETPHMRDQEGSYKKESLSFILKNLQKLQNES